MYEVAVIGCGVIGITSALTIQQRLKNVKVTIFTKDKSPNTTGDIAAGYWEPYLVGDTPPDQITKWCKDTYDYILRLWKEGLEPSSRRQLLCEIFFRHINNNEDIEEFQKNKTLCIFKGKAKEAGISLILSRYISDREDVCNPAWKDVPLGYSNLSRDYLDKFGELGNRKFISGFEFITFTWEASIFLPFLEQEFLNNGGKVIRKEIQDFEELDTFDVIVNCTGLNAKDLTGDTKLFPIRGQVARVSAPWQFHAFLIDSEHDRSCYVIPNRHCVILGGTSQPVYNTEVDGEDKRNIFRNCWELAPAAAAAGVIKHQVGLRPGRERVRLEIEIKAGGKNGLLRIVHNYGHGGSGITLSVGCAEECAKLVERALNQTNLRNKL